MVGVGVGGDAVSVAVADEVLVGTGTTVATGVSNCPGGVGDGVGGAAWQATDKSAITSKATVKFVFIVALLVNRRL
jgi:hypothetical protein